MRLCWSQRIKHCLLGNLSNIELLKIIGDKHRLYTALKGSLSQLYGYTSDADGICHAMLEESNLSYIDAKFMLVACTNFINYLIEKNK